MTWLWITSCHLKSYDHILARTYNVSNNYRVNNASFWNKFHVKKADKFPFIKDMITESYTRGHFIKKPQLLQLCTARTAWSDSVIKSASDLFGN